MASVSLRAPFYLRASQIESEGTQSGTNFGPIWAHAFGSASQVSVRAHMQTGGRSHDQRRLLTPNKKRKGGIPFLLKGVPVRGLVALPARLRPPPPVTVTDNFCDGRRGDTPFGRMRVRVVCSDQQVPMKNMISCMRTPCVARGPSQACQRAWRASAQSHTRHAKPEAIGGGVPFILMVGHLNPNR